MNTPSVHKSISIKIFYDVYLSLLSFYKCFNFILYDFFNFLILFFILLIDVYFIIKLHSPWVFYIKFILIFFLLFLQVFLLIFFYRSHHLKLNCLKTMLFDWIWIRMYPLEIRPSLRGLLGLPCFFVSFF